MRGWIVGLLVLVAACAVGQVRLESAVTFRPQGVVPSAYTLVLPRPNGGWFAFARFEGGTVIEKYDAGGKQLVSETLPGAEIRQAVLDPRDESIAFIDSGNSPNSVGRYSSELQLLSNRRIPIAQFDFIARVARDGSLFVVEYRLTRQTLKSFTPNMVLKWQKELIYPERWGLFAYDAQRDVTYITHFVQGQGTEEIKQLDPISSSPRTTLILPTRVASMTVDSLGQLWCNAYFRVLRLAPLLAKMDIVEGLPGIVGGVGDGDVFVCEVEGGSWKAEIGATPQFVPHTNRGSVAKIVGERVYYVFSDTNSLSAVSILDKDLVSNLKVCTFPYEKVEVTQRTASSVVVTTSTSNLRSWSIVDQNGVTTATRRTAQVGNVDLNFVKLSLAPDGRVGATYLRQDTNTSVLGILDNVGRPLESKDVPDVAGLGAPTWSGRDLLAVGQRDFGSGLQYGLWRLFSNGSVNMVNSRFEIVTNEAGNLAYLFENVLSDVLYGTGPVVSECRGLWMNNLGYITAWRGLGLDGPYLDTYSPQLKLLRSKRISFEVTSVRQSRQGLITVVGLAAGRDRILVYDPIRGNTLQENSLASAGGGSQNDAFSKGCSIFHEECVELQVDFATRAPGSSLDALVGKFLP